MPPCHDIVAWIEGTATKLHDLGVGRETKPNGKDKWPKDLWLNLGIHCKISHRKFVVWLCYVSLSASWGWIVGLIAFVVVDDRVARWEQKLTWIATSVLVYWSLFQWRPISRSKPGGFSYRRIHMYQDQSLVQASHREKNPLPFRRRACRNI